MNTKDSMHLHLELSSPECEHFQESNMITMLTIQDLYQVFKVATIVEVMKFLWWVGWVCGLVLLGIILIQDLGRELRLFGRNNRVKLPNRR